MSEPSFVITGATGGVGKELSSLLRFSGKNVALVGRSSEKLEELSHRLDSPSFDVDLGDFEAVESLFANIHQQNGPIVAVAHCVGNILLKPAHLLRKAEFQETMNTNALTAMSVLRAGVKCMLRESTGGAFCFFSSAASRIGLTNHEAIAAAKGAVDGLVLSAAATYAAEGIRVNAIAPGLTETPLTERITSNPRAVEASLELHPLGRLGKASDVASAAAWLLDEQQSWITGQILSVDGGLSSLKTKGKQTSH